MKTHKQTICLDFDGVIHKYDSPWENAWTIADGAVSGAVAAIDDYLDAGYDVAIYSSRSSSNRGLAAIMVWCEEHLGRDRTRRIRFPTEKPPALIYVDDRGWCFDGTFPTNRQIEDFKPWNK